MSARCRRTAAASHLPFSRQKGRGCRKEGGKEENARVVLGNVVPFLPESWLYGRLKDFTSRHAAVRRGVITALGVWQSRTHTHTHFAFCTFCSTFRTLLIEKKTSFFVCFSGKHQNQVIKQVQVLKSRRFLLVSIVQVLVSGGPGSWTVGSPVKTEYIQF